MKSRFYYERKIIGLNALLIFTLIVFIFTVAAAAGGNRLDFCYLGFEVIAPFFTAVAVSEWGKTRADDIFDIVIAQCKMPFVWVLFRYIVIFSIASGFIVVSMVLSVLIRKELPLREIFLIYFSPAFFLSTIGALGGICFKQEHIPALIAGAVWLISMLAKNLLRIQGIEYVYLFICYAGDENGVWLTNKLLIFILGVFLWILILIFCKYKEKTEKKHFYLAKFPKRRVYCGIYNTKMAPNGQKK